MAEVRKGTSEHVRGETLNPDGAGGKCGGHLPRETFQGDWCLRRGLKNDSVQRMKRWAQNGRGTWTSRNGVCGE